MPNYKETSITGTSYTRAHKVVCDNSEDERRIQFFEQRVFALPGGERMVVPSGACAQALTPDNGGTEFVLRDSNGDPTSETRTYADAYIMLMSLYYHVAAERDASLAPVEE